MNLPAEVSRMPLKLKRGLTDEEVDIQQRLRRHVEMLSEVIGIRNTQHVGGLEAAARYIENHLQTLGYQVGRQEYRAGGQLVRNIEAELPGKGRRAKEILLLGAHYDSVNCPAANDNASGVAGVLEAATQWASRRFRRTVRLVFFVNEEPPYYKGEWMGSLQYARRCRARREKIVGLINLETIGCYYRGEGSQAYMETGSRWLDRGVKLLPRCGDFVVFTGDFASWRLIFNTWRRFRRHTGFRAFGIPAPRQLIGPDMSDQWSFWQVGYPALMVTDTAFLRYPYYHQPQDLPRHMNFECMTRVVRGVICAAEDIAGRSA